jgi:glutathione S-transferase
MKRIAAVGTGACEDMTPRAAIDIARQAAPATVRLSHPMDDDPRLGSAVAIRPDEYRTEEVVGELVLLDRNELALRRLGEQVGEVVVHFPRLGYTMRRSS